MISKSFLTVALCSVIGLSGDFAQAAPVELYSSTSASYYNPVDTQQQAYNSAVSDPAQVASPNRANFSNSFGSGSSISYAGLNAVGGFSQATATGYGTQNTFIETQSMVTIRDLVVSGSGTSLVPIYFTNLHIEGSLSTSITGLSSASGNGSGTVDASVQMWVSVGGSGVVAPTDGTFGMITETKGTGGYQPFSRQTVGLLAGLGDAVNTNLTTPVWYVPLNSPFSLQFWFATTAQSLGSQIVADATSDFLHTFSIPMGASFAVVPDGYSVDSIGAGISDGCFGTCNAGQPSGNVPEPASLALAALGLVLLGKKQRRQA